MAILALLILILFPCQSYSADWYVRPYTAAGYGNKDGTTYADAWAGGAAISWGSVSPGDTVWVCGTHGDSVTGLNLYTNSQITVGASGTSGSPIYIRGDHETYPGVIYNAHARITSVWAYGAWVDSGTNGVYYNRIPSTGTKLMLEDLVIMDRVAQTISSPPAEGELNGFSAGDWGLDDSNLRIYLKPLSGSSDPNDHVYIAGADTTFAIIVDGYDYVTVKNLTIYSGGVQVKGGSDNVVIDNVTFWWSSYGVQLFGATTNVTVKNSTITQCAEGIYLSQSGGGFSDNAIIENNTITDCDGIGVAAGADNHPIGVQGGSGNIIRYNYTTGCGSGPYFYSNYAYDTSYQCYGNYIANTHGLTSKGTGITGFSGNLVISSAGEIFYNVIVNTYSDAIYTTPGTNVSHNIYNNTIYTPGGVGIKIWSIDNNQKVNTNIKNNIIHTPTDYFINIRTTVEEASWTLSNNYNLFYPNADSGTPFWIQHGATGGGAVSFADFKTITEGEANSIITDPLFVSGTDFHLQYGSPAINTGTNVGLTTDYSGNHVPKGAGYDIGAYEYGTQTLIDSGAALTIGSGAGFTIQ